MYSRMCAKDDPGLNKLTAVILCGGLGTRLRDVVSDRQKILAQVGNKPFVAYLFEQLIAHRIARVILCTGYKGEQLQKSLGCGYKNLLLNYSHEDLPLGTAGALRKAAGLIESDDALVMNGDSYCQADLNRLWLWHREKQAQATLLLTRVDDARRYGRVEVEQTGQITAFVEKDENCANGFIPRSFINAGIYLISRHLLEEIPAGEKLSLEKEVFPSWIGKGFYGYKSQWRFIDIGTPQAYRQAADFLKKIERRNYNDH